MHPQYREQGVVSPPFQELHEDGGPVQPGEGEAVYLTPDERREWHLGYEWKL